MSQAKCRSCNANIIWIRMESGEWMPVDARKPMLVYTGKDGNQPGQLIQSSGYVPHWATCPNAKQHKRKRPKLGPLPSMPGEPKKKDEGASPESQMSFLPEEPKEQPVYGGTLWKKAKAAYFAQLGSFCEEVDAGNINDFHNKFKRTVGLGELKYMSTEAIKQMTRDLQAVQRKESRAYRAARNYPRLDSLQGWFASQLNRDSLPVRVQAFFAYEQVRFEKFSHVDELAA